MYAFLADPSKRYLESDKYKTVGKYGTKGMPIIGGNRTAFQLYAEILEAASEVKSTADPDRKYFLQVQPVSIHNLLKSVCRDVGCEDKPLKVNLLRKMFARMARKGDTSDHKGLEGETAEELFRKVARGNKHTGPVADKIYAVLTPEEDAMLSEHNFLRIIGEPVKFPTDDEWKEFGPPLDVITKNRHNEVEEDVPDSDAEDDDDDKIAAELFGSGDAYMNVDEVHEEEDVPDEDLDHILALCEDAAFAVQSTATPAKPKRRVLRAQNSQEGPGASGGKKIPLGKKALKLQRRLSVQKATKTQDAEAQKRAKKKLRKGTAASDDMSKEGSPTEKKTKSSASSSKDDSSIIYKQATRKDIAAFFSVKVEPSPEEQLCTKDQQVLLQMLEDDAHGKKHCKNPFLDTEKEFLVKELRKVQPSADKMPSSGDIRRTIESGLNKKVLFRDPDVNETQHFGLVKRFFEKFLRVESKLATVS